MTLQLFGTICLIMSCALYTAGAQDDWKLVKDQQGVSVYTRTHPDYPVKEYRAETLINAPMLDVVTFFNKTELHTQWIEAITEARRVTGPPMKLYYHIEMPFPVKDRYTWLNETVEPGDQVYIVRLSEASGEARDGLIRFRKLRGYWRFEDRPGEGTFVRQQFVSDPGGSIPNWIVNMFLVKNPYKTMKNFKAAMELHGNH